MINLHKHINSIRSRVVPFEQKQSTFIMFPKFETPPQSQHPRSNASYFQFCFSSQQLSAGWCSWLSRVLNNSNLLNTDKVLGSCPSLVIYFCFFVLFSSLSVSRPSLHSSDCWDERTFFDFMRARRSTKKIGRADGRTSGVSGLPPSINGCKKWYTSLVNLSNKIRKN